MDCSPDLRSARVEVSIFGETVEKREAFIWLVNNAKVGLSVSSWWWEMVGLREGAQRNAVSMGVWRWGD